MRQCPQCHGEIEDDDIVCLHCLSQLMPSLANSEPAGADEAGPTPNADAAPADVSSSNVAFTGQPAPLPKSPTGPAAPQSPTLYDASSPTNYRRVYRRLSASILRIAALVTAGVALLLIGFLLGQWNAAPTGRPAVTPASIALPAFNEGMALYRQGRYEAAFHAFGTAADAELRNAGAAAPALAMMGWSAYRAGDYARAAEYFTAALGQDAAHADSYAGLGLTHLEQGNLLEAREMLAFALQLDDALPAAHRGLGQLYLRQNQTQMALQELRRAVALAPGDVENRAALGLALHAEGADYAAIPELEAAVAGAPTSPWLDALLESYWAMGRYDDALQAAYARHAATPTQPAWAYAYGLALWRAGKVDEAHAAFKQVLELQPTLDLAGDALRMAGVMLAQQEHYEDALDPLTRALALRPDDAAALTERGWAFARIGRCAEGLDDFVRALAIDPELPGAREGERACRQWLGQ